MCIYHTIYILHTSYINAQKIVIPSHHTISKHAYTQILLVPSYGIPLAPAPRTTEATDTDTAAAFASGLDTMAACKFHILLLQLFITIIYYNYYNYYMYLSFEMRFESWLGSFEGVFVPSVCHYRRVVPDRCAKIVTFSVNKSNNNNYGM